MICTAYGDNAVSHAVCRNWYKKFYNGNFDLKDQSRSGRTVKFESDELQTLLNQDTTPTHKDLRNSAKKPFPIWFTSNEKKFGRRKSECHMNRLKITKCAGVTLHCFCYVGANKGFLASNRHEW